MSDYEIAVKYFNRLSDEDKYEIVKGVFGKQKVAIEAVNGEIKVLSKPDNVDVVVHHEPVARCCSCGNHKYRVRLAAMCGYGGCGMLCLDCMTRCPVCFNAYCFSDLKNHINTAHRSST